MGRGPPDYAEFVTSFFPSPVMLRRQDNKTIHTQTEWRYRTVKIAYHETTDTIDLHLNCGHLPLTLLDLLNYFEWVSGSFFLPRDAWTLNKIEINIDHIGYTVVKEIQGMDNIEKFILRIYKKTSDTVRTEAVVPTRIKLSELMPSMRIICQEAERFM